MPMRFARIAGPLVALVLLLAVEVPGHPAADAMLAVVVWMAIWWISECVPLALTALLPLVSFPLLGIATGKQLAPHYVNHIIFLFIGGFLIAQAMETSRLHQRIALHLLNRFHASPLQLAMGFAVVTAGLSMWISNTATTLLMVTIAMPLLTRLMEEHGREQIAPMAGIMLLVIAYSANLGGIGTPVGTAPNLVFLENISAINPQLTPSFLQWMMVGIPVVLAGLLVLFLLFAPILRRLPWQQSNATVLRQALQQLGPMRREERWVGWVLGSTAVLWITRQGITTNDIHLPGWGHWLPYPGVGDGSVAILGAGLLFLLTDQQGKPILDGTAINRLPWDIVLLLGGGFALAFGMQHSGLSAWLGESLGFLHHVPLPLMLLGVTLLVIFLTEVTSNTATTQVMLPILAAVASAYNMDPMLLLLPATLAASCAFMMPVATPPNAIAFGTHLIPMQTMNRYGLYLNLIMTMVIISIVWFFRPLLPA